MAGGPAGTVAGRRREASMACASDSSIAFADRRSGSWWPAPRQPRSVVASMKGCTRSLIPAPGRPHERIRPPRGAALARSHPPRLGGPRGAPRDGDPSAATSASTPRATSLHVGHLLQVFLLTHLQRAGGRPVIVIGGGTGMIGDPSGKSSERKLLDEATIEANSAALRRQLERFLDFTPGPTQPRMVDNRDWLASMSVIDFLRDIGKHFTVPYMLAKDSVQARLAAGMSFTEFSYQTLQATDFLHLHRHEGVDMQMGGADQWGNITAGLELIRRVEGRGESAADSGDAACRRADRLRALQPAAADALGPEDGQVREGRRLPRRRAHEPLRLLPVLDQRRRRPRPRSPALADHAGSSDQSRASRPSRPLGRRRATRSRPWPSTSRLASTAPRRRSGRWPSPRPPSPPSWTTRRCWHPCTGAGRLRVRAGGGGLDGPGPGGRGWRRIARRGAAAHHPGRPLGQRRAPGRSDRVPTGAHRRALLVGVAGQEAARGRSALRLRLRAGPGVRSTRQQRRQRAPRWR